MNVLYSEKVICICGKLCSGKTTYARRLCEERSAVILSVDEIMLAVFGQYAGEKHEIYVHRLYKFLCEKAVQIVKAGVNVVLDCGFWTKDNRDKVRAFFNSHGIQCEIHYIDICDEDWEKFIEKRNASALVHQDKEYYIDSKLKEKFRNMFEMPSKEEIDTWIII